MSSRISFIQPGYENFPLVEDIFEYVPLPIVTFAEPAVGCENNPNSCRLVRDVTQSPPQFPSNPLCFTLPDIAETAEVFIAAMRGTVPWNQVQCKESNSKETNAKTNVGRISYHDKIWRFTCPCAGLPRKPTTAALNATNPNIVANLVPRTVNTTVNKDGSIAITSKNVTAYQTVTTIINGTTKKTVVATEVTGEPCTQPPTPTRQREPSIKCNCLAKFFIRRRIDNGMHEVKWYWAHQNHDPFSLTDMKRMRASGPLKEWLSEKVLAGMTWPTLRKLLRNSDLNRVGFHHSKLSNKADTSYRNLILHSNRSLRHSKLTIRPSKT